MHSYTMPLLLMQLLNLKLHAIDTFQDTIIPNKSCNVVLCIVLFVILHHRTLLRLYTFAKLANFSKFSKTLDT